MAAGRGRGGSARGRGVTAYGTGLAAALLVAGAAAGWAYALAVVLAGGLTAAGCRLWRTDRGLRRHDRRWRHEQAVEAGRRSLATVDAMTGGEFEELVAALCRRDGCTRVRRVGGAYDGGADVMGRLPDGRTMVVQCKRYAPSRTVASRELRDLLGAKVHFGARVAVFVTTTRFSRPAEEFARHNGILAVHRDLLGLWHNGTALPALGAMSGHGQGDARHRARWKQAYGK
ncbi:restriction endonuclease [Streptomyces sp. NPDC049915]|uniref:restriction endonuclease n=1 Tax=Streptomyces sp. NPDC049915 TaxID=3155510 RepID=UPI003420A9E2